REVRYRYFDQPLFEKARKQVYAQLEGHLAYLSANANPVDRHERVRALIDCPQPLASIFASRFGEAAANMRNLMLEALTLRFYRIRTLVNFHTVPFGDQSCVTAEYDYEGKRIHIFATHCDYENLRETLQNISSALQDVSSEEDVVIDVYAWHLEAPTDVARVQEEVCRLINETHFLRSIRRIVVAVGNPGDSKSHIQYFTYRPRSDGYREEELFRGLHPMMAKRLHLWRLSNFNIDRLPTAEDVYLIHGVARDNPKDERLFGCAEVRDVTPVRNTKGRIVALPHLERMLMEVLAGIRLFQSRREPQKRLHWNRILLYVWEPLRLTSRELKDIVHRLSPAASGLGLEQVVVRARIPNSATGELRDMVLRVSNPGGNGTLITFRRATQQLPIKPMSDYEQKVVRMRQRGLIYPYEIVKMLTPPQYDAHAEFPTGDFIEHDLDTNGALVPVDRPHGQNKANIIVGV